MSHVKIKTIQKSTIFTDLIAGSVGGMAGVAVGQPFDLVKV